MYDFRLHPLSFSSFLLVFFSWTTELWCFVNNNNAEVWALPQCPIIHSTIGNFAWTNLFWFGGFILGVLTFFPRFISLSFARETDTDGALVGSVFLSDSLQVLFHRLASHEVLNFIMGHKFNHALLKKLKRKFLSVHTMLNDAEVKQITNPTVKEEYYIKCFLGWYVIVIRFFIE